VTTIPKTNGVIKIQKVKFAGARGYQFVLQFNADRVLSNRELSLVTEQVSSLIENIQDVDKEGNPMKPSFKTCLYSAQVNYGKPYEDEEDN